MSLSEYQRKRDFSRTREPKGAPGHADGFRFVVQKHAASRLHYDFRLELGGALKSWAVPKGIPFQRGEKHLAVQVEDHPVSYIDFEGTISQGQYGGGTVMVWDCGRFSTEAADPLKALAGGKLNFTLHGKKLLGDWHLVSMRNSNQWLLIKGGGSAKPVSRKSDDTSAVSGRNMAQLAEGKRVWQSSPAKARRANLPRRNQTAAKWEPLPAGAAHFIEPMKARLLDAPPAAGRWLYEIKFDGFRAQAEKQGAKVSLLSRNERDFAARFPEIAAAVAALPARDAVLDGEIVALEPDGVSSFQLLQAYELGEERPTIYFYAFDLLRLNGEELLGARLSERRARLQKLLGAAQEPIRFSADLGEDAGPLLKRAKKLGLEGLIGKRADSLYEPGRRSGAWIKLKLRREQEFVIGGYTDPAGARGHFGALLVGFYERKRLRFCGKVGTGFDRRALEKLHGRFQPLLQAECPFANLPETRGSRHSVRMTPAEMRRCHWLRPRLVGQIKFADWTNDEKLRQPVFLGLRDDKAAREVAKERPN